MKKWKILGKINKPKTKVKTQDIVNVLLANRNIKSEKEKKTFYKPEHPDKLTLRSLGINTSEVKKTIKRIKQSLKNKEKVIVYGDYDADGICATAILWECLYDLGLDVLPYIPERFSEGYGIKAESVKKLKEEHPKLGLIITVDNGIVAAKAVSEINKLGVDVIITDHHEPEKKFPKAFALVHTTKIGGAGVAWILAREIKNAFKVKSGELGNGLDLVAIGSIADLIVLLGPNRSFVKHGLVVLNKTKRLGLISLFRDAKIIPGSIGTYEIGFIIAPRLNAMGRMKHAIDSLRLLCTKDESRADELSRYLNKTNYERQKTVEEVVIHAKGLASQKEWEGVIILAHEDYHEGVIGLAAAKLVEMYYRPSIVLSKGEDISKASARSISGFNIIDEIRKLDDILVEGGGHPMAAGFSIKTNNIDEFISKFEASSSKLLTDDILTRELKIDLEVDFKYLSWGLQKSIALFGPTGLGNPTPTLTTRKVNVFEARTVGMKGKHLKLVLEKNGKVFNAIAFGFGELVTNIAPKSQIDIAYVLEENVWNNEKKLQLRIKDIKIN